MAKMKAHVELVSECKMRTASSGVIFQSLVVDLRSFLLSETNFFVLSPFLHRFLNQEDVKPCHKVTNHTVTVSFELYREYLLSASARNFANLVLY